MVQRTECLCDGKIIGIESIYTVINGKQINIPEKLEALRVKNRNNELLCHCGCRCVYGCRIIFLGRFQAFFVNGFSAVVILVFS